MTIARDQSILGGISRSPSNRKNGTILFHSTFENGSREGWRQHYSGLEGTGDPLPPLSLTRYPPPFQGEYALLLTSTDRAYAEIPAGNAQQFSAYKNLGRYFTTSEVKLLTFSGYFAEWNTGGYAPNANWGIGIDSQLYDNSDRSFFKMMVRRPSGSAAQVYLANNAGAMVALTPTNVSKNHVIGLNQNKFNYNYVELTVDLSQNSGRGAYHSGRVNDLTFDFTNSATWADPTQSGQQTPQGAVGDPATTAAQFLDYRGGLNFGIFGDLLPGSLGAFGLICDELTATIYDED